MSTYDGKLQYIALKRNKTIIHHTDNTAVETIGIVSKTKKNEVDHPASERFKNMVRAFLGHGLTKLGLLCSNLDEKAMKARKCIDMPEFKNFAVASLKFSGDGDNEKLNIGLVFEAADGEEVAINVPAIKLNGGGYPYEALLKDDIANVTAEANMFLEDKNYLGQKQLSMFGAEDDGEVF